MGKPRERPQLIIAAHYMRIGGEIVQIDPKQTDLPDRCKLVIAETMSGRKCKLVEPVCSS